jgi:transposase InsO family protein
MGSPQPELTGANQQWALDFAHDVIAAGRTIRVLSVVDAQCLALEVDTGFASRRVTRVLDEIIASHGRPLAITHNRSRVKKSEVLAAERPEERSVVSTESYGQRPSMHLPDTTHLTTSLCKCP